MTGEAIPARTDRLLLLVALLQLGALAFHVPLATLTGSHRALVGLESALMVGFSVTVVSHITFLLVRAWSRSGWKALAWVSVALLFFWHWDGLTAIEPFPHWLTSGLLLALSLVAAGRFAEARRFRIVAFAICATLACTLTFLIVRIHIATPPPVVTSLTDVRPVILTRTPDVVLLVLDAYARADVLRSLYDFDNSPFLADLSEAGFEVAASANTNYSTTHFSVASMLEMSYLAGAGDSISNSDLGVLTDMISGNNQVVEVLKDNGYTYVHGDTDHWLNTCGPAVDHCLPGPLIDVTADALLAGTPVGPLLYPSTGDPSTALNLTRIDQLSQWDEFRAEFGEGPAFVFLHVILPHPPLFLDSTCQPRLDPSLGGRNLSLGQYDEEALAHRRKGFIDQTECANSSVLDFIEGVDSEAIVVITADHGPDSLKPLTAESDDLTAQQKSERMATFTAIRMPPGCEPVPEDHQLVNTFRLVLGCLSGTPVDALDKRYYIAGYGGSVQELKDPDSPAEAHLIDQEEQKS